MQLESTWRLTPSTPRDDRRHQWMLRLRRRRQEARHGALPTVSTELTENVVSTQITDDPGVVTDGSTLPQLGDGRVIADSGYWRGLRGWISRVLKLKKQ